MAWIKRNLFFFIGGLVALGLLGAAAYYNYANWSRNAASMAALEETFNSLKELSDPSKSPGNEQHPRILQARDQEKLARDWLGQTHNYFKPIDRVPSDNPITSESFAAALRRTIDVLQHEATNSNVMIPPGGYGFSFEAERTRVTFDPASLDILATQLGEVKTISEILYAAGVNDFDGIQRVRAAVEDANGPGGDYVSDQVTASGTTATLTPYVITFRSFTPEIAQVFTGFIDSPHAFIVKSINVAPAPADNNAPAPVSVPVDYPRHGRIGAPGVDPNAPSDRGGLVTVLKEKLLRITMEVEIVKLQPK
jgi:hypothetical protein